MCKFCFELTRKTPKMASNPFIYPLKTSFSGGMEMKLKLFWCIYCKLRTNFTHCSGVSILHFEQINARWDKVLFCPIIMIRDLNHFYNFTYKIKVYLILQFYLHISFFNFTWTIQLTLSTSKTVCYC